MNKLSGFGLLFAVLLLTGVSSLTVKNIHEPSRMGPVLLVRLETLWEYVIP
jgi:hypothetical protein